MRGVGTDIVRARFGLTGDQLADIVDRHRALLDTRDLFLLARRTELVPVLSCAAAKQRAPRPGAAHGWSPPPPPVGSRIFSKHTAWEEFERWRVDLGPRRMRVPGGALISGGTRAWRCAEVP